MRSRRSTFALIGLLSVAGVGALAVQAGGGRLKQWLLALHGVPAGGHGATRPRRAVNVPAPSWPQTNAGQAARRWVEAFSSGEEAMRQVLTRDFSSAVLAQRGIEERLANYRTLHQRFGTLTLDTLGPSSDSALQVTLLSADGAPHDFTFEVEVEAPFKLSSVKFLDTQTHPH